MKKLLLITFMALGLGVSAQTYTKEEVKILQKGQLLQSKYDSKSKSATNMGVVSLVSAGVVVGSIVVANKQGQDEFLGGLTTIIFVTLPSMAVTAVSSLIGINKTIRASNFRNKRNKHFKKYNLVIVSNGEVEFQKNIKSITK